MRYPEISVSGRCKRGVRKSVSNLVRTRSSSNPGGFNPSPPGGRPPRRGDDAFLASPIKYRTVACLVTNSSPVPLKTRRVGQRCTLNLSRAEMSSRWCGVVVRRGGVPAQVSSTSLDHGPKCPRVAEQCDVNIKSNQINPSIRKLMKDKEFDTSVATKWKNLEFSVLKDVDRKFLGNYKDPDYKIQVSDDENEMNDTAFAPTSSQMRKATKRVCSYLDAHYNSEMNNKMDDI
ncbi:uncharacterized protein TNCV_814111 [Trichonephila clavipes]|nr:uncharacterized protein TNCV_814111 [Trichonephila clavipes]